MSHSLKIRIGIIFLFVFLIFIHLLPLSLHPFDALNDTKDCVLNTWIPGWVQQQLFKDPLNLFNTNTFYPHTNTLSYSEHLFPQALISLPVKLLTNNPIAVYNFIFFFSFFLSVYGMILLTRHLTKNDFIGIVCGIIFAFNTYQINQITHLQLLSSGLIPLAFLYLHKYLEEQNFKNSFLFATFLTLQSLACIYYGLFFISVLFVLLPAVLILYRKKISFSFALRLGVPLVFSSIILALFSLPNLSFIKTFEFDRGLHKGADLVNYLAVDFTNIFLSKILNPLGHHEHFLFPGIAALFFAVFFLYKKRIINGYSGFVPPVTHYMQRIFKGFPSWPCVDILKSLGVDYVIYHPTLWEEKMASTRVERIEKDFSDDLELVNIFRYEFKKPNALSDFFGEDLIYQVISHEDKKFIFNPILFSELKPTEWTATANRGTETISFLKDKDLKTKWNTRGPKKTGDFLLIEFERPVSAAWISLQLGSFFIDYALNLHAEISSDGTRWANIPRPYSAGEFTKDWINNPLEPIQNIYVEGDKIKYLKIIHIGDDKGSLWSVAEMEISVIY